MNSNDIRWLTERLPPMEKITLRSEPDYYGASYEISSQLGKAQPPHSFATWRHGWVHQPITHLRQLVPYGQASERHLVATEEHVYALQRFGFPHAVAVGLPFIYATAAEIARQPGSLIVLPSHSLPYTAHAWDEHSYVEQIVQLRAYFPQIVACVHSSCVAKGLWTTAFERHGIPWIVGAMVEDRNALRRMATIFRAFECMTTNTLGSHVAYAAYSGCKVSIYGPYASISAEEHAQTPLYVRYPELLKFVVEQGQESVVREQYPDLFVSPIDATTREAWGAEMLGACHQQPPEAVAGLLGWSPREQMVGHGRRLLTHMQRKLFSPAQRGRNE